MPATAHFNRWLEGRATSLRRKLRLDAIEPLDPFALADSMRIPVVTPKDIIDLPAACSAHVLGDGASHWSGGTVALPHGGAVVVLNPTHARTRQRATLMEELAHVHLNHQPSEICIHGAMAFRSFKKSQETQAYWLGAAALLPHAAISHCCDGDLCADEIAERYGVSVQLVRFRCNTTGLKVA